MKSNKRPCQCGSYWFPHRLGSGACIHNPNKISMIKLLGKRQDLSEEQIEELIFEYLLSEDSKSPKSKTDDCPF